MSETTRGGDTTTFTEEERAAMKERAKELKSARKRSKGGSADVEGEVLAKIAEMPDDDRAMAERLHALVRSAAPNLEPRLWYGMPAYSKDGKVLCFFQPASKFKARYSTLGFDDSANLDEGSMWATSFALRELTPETERRITKLLERAVS